MEQTKLYQKKALVAVIAETIAGIYVHNTANVEDQWMIPTKVFKETYVELKRDFSWALQRIKEGEAVRRAHWDDEKYIVVVSVSTEDQEENEIVYNDTLLALKDENDNWTPGWVPDNEDLFAEDYVLVHAYEQHEDDRSGYKLEN